MKPGENKNQFTKRVAKKRISRILHEFKLLGHLATPNYNLTERQINKIFNTLDKAYENMKILFIKQKTEFNF